MLVPSRTPLKTLFGEQNTIPKICSYTASCQNNPFSFPHFPRPFPSLQVVWPHFPMVAQTPSLIASLPPFLLPSFTPSNIACLSSLAAQRQHSCDSFKLFLDFHLVRKPNKIRQNYIKRNKLPPC